MGGGFETKADLSEALRYLLQSTTVQTNLAGRGHWDQLLTVSFPGHLAIN